MRRVLAMQTPIIVFDEPTTGQDAAGLSRLAGLLDELELANMPDVARCFAFVLDFVEPDRALRRVLARRDHAIQRVSCDHAEAGARPR